MATAQMDTVIRHLRRAVLRQDAAGRTDGQLLTSFIEEKDETAFATLVRLHGPMVLGLARRVLRDHQLAEDVFQAVFLILARKAHAVRSGESLPAWLHNVAFRLALRARKNRERAAVPPIRAVRTSSPDPLDELTVRELLAIFDEELQRLRTAYRLPLILCCLEGHTQEEAARQLGWTPGAVPPRCLTKAKTILIHVRRGAE